MKFLDRLTLAAAGGAGTMTGFLLVLAIADQMGTLDVLLNLLAGAVQAVCQ